MLLSLLGCIPALGERLAGGGYLWQLIRRRLTFLASTAIMFVIWWISRAGMGFMGGIPAFMVGLLGFVLFVGVLTERSRSIWPSVLAHGPWNALVATYFSSSGAVDDRVFTGSQYPLGEFGWLGAGGMLILGIGFAWWHFPTPTKDALSSMALARPAGHSKDGPCERDGPIPLTAAHTSSHCTRGSPAGSRPLFEVMARAAARNQLDAASTEKAP